MSLQSRKNHPPSAEHKNATAARFYLRRLKAKQKPEPRVPEDLQGLQHTLVVLAHNFRRQKPRRKKEAAAALKAFRERPRCPGDLELGLPVRDRYTYIGKRIDWDRDAKPTS
jgi:hypothetical protein